MMQSQRFLFHCAAGVFIAVCTAGCATHLEVHRARLAENGALVITDPEPVPMPSRASSKIPVFWKNYDNRDASGAKMPDRPYEVIGRAHGVIGVVAQDDLTIDGEFRRAAAALGGDAVIEVKKGKWIPRPPSNEYTGRIIKWKKATAPAENSAEK